MNLTPAAGAFSPERVLRRLPPPLPSARVLRYRGDDRAVALSALVANDRDAVRVLYATLVDFESAVRAGSAQPDTPDAAHNLAKAFPLDHALVVARSIGRGPEEIPDDIRHALHDVRGGALTSLLMEVQRVLRGQGDKRVRALRTLTADHLKVMRNAVRELDDERRSADLEPMPHSVERLAETLGRVTGEGTRGSVRASVHCSFVGTVTTSCVELGALDRAVLNVVNNAVRHAATDRIEIALLATTSDPGGDLRILVANAVEDGQARALRARFGDELGRIFLEPFSTTGSGDGLKICVGFVSAAYGLVRDADTVREGLVGATLDDGWFAVWLHWPSVA